MPRGHEVSYHFVAWAFSMPPPLRMYQMRGQVGFNRIIHRFLRLTILLGFIVGT